MSPFETRLLQVVATYRYGVTRGTVARAVVPPRGLFIGEVLRDLERRGYLAGDNDGCMDARYAAQRRLYTVTDAGRHAVTA